MVAAYNPLISSLCTVPPSLG